MNGILNVIEGEIRNRQDVSNSISCPSFLPVVQALVNPNKEPHRGSHSRSHFKSKKPTGATSPRSTFSDYSIDDSISVSSKQPSYSVKLESLSPQIAPSPISESTVTSPKSPPFSMHSQGLVFFTIYFY